MRCSSCERDLDRYVEGTLNAQRMRAVSAHVASCAGCSALITELRVVDGLLATASSPQLAPNFTFAVMSDVRTTNRVPVRRRAWLLATAATVIAWCAAVVWLYQTHRLSAVGALGSMAQTAIAEVWSAGFGALHSLGFGAPITISVLTGVFVLDCVVGIAVFRTYRARRARIHADLEVA